MSVETMPFPITGLTVGSAIIQDPYRYHLARRWGPGDMLGWMMLNPSTADDATDDATIRRCVGFSIREGYEGIQVVNLFGLRATNPAELLDHDDPVGPLNRATIRSSLMSLDAIVAGWGASIEKIPAAGAERDWFMETAGQLDVTVLDLGTTKAGHPRHPLYLRSDTPLRII